MRTGTYRGSVIIPAHNEASVITRTLSSLGPAAAAGHMEVIVVCNGCTDRTASLARSIDGIRVIEIDQASKIDALNAGDAAATQWPRLYLDADIDANASTVLDTIDRLHIGDILAARPPAYFATDGAATLVRRYYRARTRIPQFHTTLWGGGVYAMTESGHDRFGTFPPVIGDDFFVDSQFRAHEKLIVDTDPVVVRTPRVSKDLLAILRRAHRVSVEDSSADHKEPFDIPASSASATVQLLARTIRGPQSVVDAAVYAGFALRARLPKKADPQNAEWERDNSSRV